MEHIFRSWIGMHRAMLAWFHAAHHVTKGTSFGGDHVNIFGEIYTQLEDDLDAIVEKGLGLTGDETLADPVSSLSMAASLLAQQPATANQTADWIASNALEVMRGYIDFLEGIFSQLESIGMSLGLNDMISGFANQYETYVYLLHQRSKTLSLQKENRMRRFGRNLRETTFDEFREMAKGAGRGMSIGSKYHHAFMVNPEFWCAEIEAELGSCSAAQDFSDLLPEEQKVMMSLVKSGVRAPQESASAPLKKNNSWSATNESVRLTRGQLRRIIREVHSRLIKESWDETPPPAGSKSRYVPKDYYSTGEMNQGLIDEMRMALDEISEDPEFEDADWVYDFLAERFPEAEPEEIQEAMDSF